MGDMKEAALKEKELRLREEETENGRQVTNDLRTEQENETSKTSQEGTISIFGNTKVKDFKSVSMLVDIISFRITNQHDFVIMGCSGVFEHLSDKYIVGSIWTTNSKRKGTDIHEQCGIGVDSVLKNALLYRSPRNVTSVIIAFQSFKNLVFPKMVESPSTNPKEKNEKRSENSMKTCKCIMGQLPATKRNSSEAEYKAVTQNTTNDFLGRIQFRSTKKSRMELLRKNKSIIAEMKSYNI